jgi:hypothetical protein
VIEHARHDHELVDLRALDESLEAGADRLARANERMREHALGGDLLRGRPVGVDVVEWRLLETALAAMQVGERLLERREEAPALAVRVRGDDVVLATGRFVGEGFDDARLDTLFLTMPVAWKGTVVRYAERLHRFHRSTFDVCIRDYYVDARAPIFARMFEKRLRVRGDGLPDLRDERRLGWR